MHYRSFADLASAISRNLWRIPADIDLIVGIPRSGLFAAWYTALLVNRHVVDLPSFLQGSVGDNGFTRPVKGASGSHGRPRKILLVDDCLGSGKSMTRALESIRAQDATLEIVTLAVFVVPRKAKLVDIGLEHCPLPQVFEWNIFHTWIVENSCYDMDGVLCVDPSPQEDDDGEKYLHFIQNAQPLIVPTGRIRKIVTARLEKYRNPTEEWLARHGVDYGELIMLDLPTAAERRRVGNPARYKAEVYKSDPGAELFVESHTWEAERIARHSGKPVFDASARNMVAHDPLSIVYRQHATRLFLRRVKQRLLRDMRSLTGGRAKLFRN